MLRPTERRSVLFPDMFEPVMRSTVPGGPMATSLATRRSSAMSGWPMASAVTSRTAPISGTAHSGIVPAHGAELRERVELAERVEPAPDAATAHLAPALEREEHVEVPERQRLHGKVQNRRAAPQLAEAEDAIEPAHALRRGMPLRRQPLEKSPAAAPAPRGAVTACSKIAA